MAAAMTRQAPGFVTSSQHEWRQRKLPEGHGPKFCEDDRATPRDLFPLKPDYVEAPPKAGLSRGVHQRIQRRRAIQSELANSAWGLSALAGSKDGNFDKNSVHQTAAIEHLRQNIVLSPPPNDAATAEEAFTALLGRSRSYNDSSFCEANVKPYDRDLLSIPSVGEQPVLMTDKLPQQASEFLGDISNILVDPNIFGSHAMPNHLYGPQAPFFPKGLLSVH